MSVVAMSRPIHVGPSYPFHSFASNVNDIEESSANADRSYDAFGETDIMTPGHKCSPNRMSPR